MIITISGYKRHGKDTVAKMIVENSVFNFETISLAAPMKQMVCDLFDIDLDYLEELKDDETKSISSISEVSMRRILQYIGQLVKEYSNNEKIWLNYLIGELDNGKNYIIPDVRFPFELEGLKLYAEKTDQKFISIKVHNSNKPVDTSHESERYIKDIKTDIEIINDGSLRELRDKVYDQILIPNLLVEEDG